MQARFVVELAARGSVGTDELTERWHDQFLDLQSLTHDPLEGVVKFQVIEENTARKVPVAAIGPLGLFRVPLSRCDVTVRGATLVRVEPEDEVELFIARVESGASGDVLCFKGMNAILEIRGVGLVLESDCVVCDELECHLVDLLVFQTRNIRRKRKNGGAGG